MDIAVSTPEPTAAAGPSPSRLRELRRANRLLREELEARRLAVASARLQLRESLDWVQPYMDLVRQAGPLDTSPFGPASRNHRRKGQNYPVYRTEVQLNILRAASRSLLANNGFAQGMLAGLRAYVIGPGYTYRPAVRPGVDGVPPDLIAALNAIIGEVHAANEWFGGELPMFEAEAFDRSFEDGEFFVRSFFRTNGITLFRFVEPEQVTAPPGDEPGYDWSLGGGTPESDVQTPTMYHVQYGDGGGLGDLCEPAEITPLRRKAKRTMKRGVPEFAFGTLDLFDLAKELAENIASGAAEQAAIASVMKVATGTADDIRAIDLAAADGRTIAPETGREELYRRARRREHQTIGDGQEYVQGPAATNTAGHLAALDATLRYAGRAWQAPEWLANSNANGQNYATSLTAESPFVIWVQEQQKLYTAAFRRLIWAAVQHAVTLRGVRASGRMWTWPEVAAAVELTVEAPTPISRDPLADAQRLAVELPLGVDSPQAYCQRHGRDYHAVQSDLDEHLRLTGGPGDPLDDAGAAGRTSPP